jgi:hypothetical protein
MRKVLKNTRKTQKYLDSCKKIYTVFLWARFGIREVAWSGKFEDGEPLVYEYYDANGERDEYRLMPVSKISSGGFVGWYLTKEVAEWLCNKLNGGSND